MGNTICPGQDTAFWRPGDIFEVECSACGNQVEFFKDDATRRCRQCGAQIANPKLNLGCAQWCEHAEKCLGYDPKKTQAPEGEHTPLVERLISALRSRLDGDQAGLSQGLERLEWAGKVMAGEGGEPRAILAAALLSPLGLDQALEVLGELKVDPATQERVDGLLRGLAQEGTPQELEARVLADALGLAAQVGPAGPWLTPTGEQLQARQAEAAG